MKHTACAPIPVLPIASKQLRQFRQLTRPPPRVPDADADERCLLFYGEDEGGGGGRSGELEQLIERLFPIGTHSVSLAHLQL